MSKLKSIAAALLVTASLTGLAFSFNTATDQSLQIVAGDEIKPDGRDRVVMPPV